MVEKTKKSRHLYVSEMFEYKKKYKEDNSKES